MKILQTRTALVLAVILVVAAAGWFVWSQRPPIKVGVLHSLTGTMAFSETAVVDATLMAIDEINAQGGVLGRRVEPIVVDGRSDPARFALEAERLFADGAVDTIFGCWTSACRRTLGPVVEKHDKLLFYAVQYEGVEQSPNIVYLGATPNQQILPAVKWALRSDLKRLYLVGSDYVFPRVANAIIRDYVEKWRGEIVGERYLLLGDHDVDDIVRDIVKTRPDAILNTINGDSNIAFFHALRAAGVTPQDIPTISFSISEPELSTVEPSVMAGDFASWSYFQSIERPRNRDFVTAFKARYGKHRVVGAPMAAAYTGVYLWAGAVAAAGSASASRIRANVGNTGYNGPGGLVYVDGDNQHIWSTVHIGRIGRDGQFDIVWSSDVPTPPIPYPASRSRAEWDAYLQQLYDKWGGRWSNPGDVD